MNKRQSHPIKVYLENRDGYLSLTCDSRYACTSSSVNTPQQLVAAIEDVCGKGSFCLYKGKGQNYPDSISYLNHKDHWNSPITYWQQGVKTQVIEEAREVAREVWGDIPEMEIGWLENQCRSYVEDLDPIVQSYILGEYHELDPGD